ncbi:MAG: CPBP family intramembrane metalloprotease [Deltaproteobacteria bacterium]|nr:CPBP family intramembrane metalloprotease [Deltaproteobacteria bacterium]
MVARLYRFLVTDQMDALDRLRDEPPQGPRSPAFQSVAAMLVVALMLCVMNFLVLDGEFQARMSGKAIRFAEGLPEGGLRDLLLSLGPLYRHAVWSLGCTSIYFVVPALVVRFVFREPLANYGALPRRFFRHLPIYLALFVPVFVAVVVVSYTEAFQRTYPFYHYPNALWDLLVWEVLYCLQFFALEFFFRGFMIHATKRTMGSMAVWAMVIPYCMIHFQKPAAEAVAAILAGTVLGVLSLRTNTIWGGVFIHSAVAIAMDWASLLQRGALPF